MRLGIARYAADRPVIFDAHVSADIAQLPPHISFEEAHKFLSALIAGDPDERGTSSKSRSRASLPG